MTTTGSKGSSSGSARTPVEAPDDLISTSTAKVLDLLSEGEIVGLKNGEASVFLSETPVTTNGTRNFTGVQIQTRNGSQDQSYIQGFPSSESEFSVGSVVSAVNPYVRAISNNQLSAVRVRLLMPRSVSVNPSNGDSTGTVTEYRIDLATDGGPYQLVLQTTFTGKTTTGYDRSHRIDLPPSTSGWLLKITRLTPDSTSQNLINEFSVASVSEVIDAKFRYPNSALVATQFDAKQFDSIPSRAFHALGRIIRVPTNYDPVSRTYNGVWDGSFKTAYTNNPAWVYYDLLLNERYGLGKRINAAQIDRYELYRIAQYCDQLVPDGFGGQEPRYTCNLYLQSRAEALKVLQDVASIFRGMAYWGASQMYAAADMPGDSFKTFTNANVVDGKFSYKGTALRSRYNVALVTWNDMNDFGRQKVEYVEDQDLLRQIGRVQSIELTATGCTSRGQAQRNGRWAIFTNNLEQEIVSFSGGLECAYLRPGMIIRVADANRAGARNGGRISAVTGTSLTTDRMPGDVRVGDTVVIPSPSGASVTRTITSINGNTVGWSGALAEIPLVQSSWAFESDRLALQKFRVVSVNEKAAGITYTVSATKHVEGKYDGIESGVKIEQPPISQIPASTQVKPENVRLTSDWAIEQTMAVTTMTIAWDPAPGAVEYAVQWRKDDNSWISAGRTSSTEIDVKGVYSGKYIAQVMAINVFGQGSPWATSPLTSLNGKEGEPPSLATFTATPIVFGIQLDWGFPADATDTLRTEIEYGVTQQDTQKLGDFAYPVNTHTMMGLRAGQQFFFRARLVDRSGNIGPWTDFISGMSSADADEILDYLTGQITATQLGQDLTTEIGKIDGDGPGSVNERLGEVRSDLQNQIDETNTTITNVQTELQDQIDQIADLSDPISYNPDDTYTTGQGTLGADGRIYQAKQNVPINTPPPNATYWTDVGQAVVTANGLASRVTTAETKITDIEGVNTVQAQQITALRSDVDGKASATALQSLTTRVTTVEGSVSSQGTAITGLTNSLTVTNQNVTAVTNTANGKGKVFYQTTAPAAAEQLAQNLWVDITNGANTPKRWNGSAWVAVTDKVATDAAAAAASALSQVATKAEASTVQALQNTVTQQGTDLTAAGSAITAINASLSQMGAGAVNLLPAEMTVFGAVAPDTTANGGATKTTTADAAAMKGYALTTTWTAATGQALLLAKDFTFSSCNMSFKRQKYIVSFWARSDVAGHQVGCYLRTFLADNVSTLTGPAPLFTLTTEWARYSAVIDMTSASFTGSQMAMVLQQNRSGVGGRTVWYDRIMLESAVGSVTEPSTFVIGNSFDQISAQAAATTALTARVTQTETGLTSVSGQLTQLTNNIGSMGGDNLLPNSSFEQASSTGWPLYWRGAGSVSPTVTFVDSTLSSSLKAVRLANSAVPNGGYIDLQLYATEGPDPKLVAGQTYTLSVYARLSSPSARLAMYIQWLNSSGSVISTAQLAETAVGTTFTRMSFTATAPAGTVAGHVYAGRLLNRAGATADMWIELDNVQLQEGSTLTAYSPSVQAVTSQAAATSAAVDSLSSTVTQQGTSLTSVAARTTTLENAVNSTTNGLATKASASAVDTLTNRVTVAEGNITSTSGAVTQLQNTVGAIGGSGSNILPVEFTTFGSTLPTMAAGSGAVLSAVALATSTGGYLLKAGVATSATGYLYLGTSTTDYNIRLKPNGKYILSFWAYGSVAHSVGLRIKYVTSAGGTTEVEVGQQAITTTLTRYSVAFTAPAALVDRCVIVIFPNRTAAVADTFFDGFMLETQIGNSTAASDFVPGQAARQLSAQATAISALTTTVTQQGTTISAQATSITGLQSTVGTQTSQIQTLQSTTADSAGKVAAAYSVRLNLAQNGLNYVAGFGIGLDNSAGVLQSQFIVAVDRFAVIRDVAGNVTSPFIIENGQVFMADAVIKKATITNALIGQSISSLVQTSYGVPVMTTDYNAGTIVINNKATNGKSIILREDGLFATSGGVTILELRV